MKGDLSLITEIGKVNLPGLGYFAVAKHLGFISVTDIKEGAQAILAITMIVTTILLARKQLSKGKEP